MAKYFKSRLKIAFILLVSLSFSQEKPDGLVLNLNNQEIHYYNTHSSNEVQQKVNKIVFDLTLHNYSNGSYYIAIDTTTFNIFNELEYYKIKSEVALKGSPYTIFRPNLTILNSIDEEAFSYTYHFQPEIGSDFSNEIIKSMKERNKEMEYANEKYGQMVTEERPDLPQFYYLLKEKYNFIIQPGESINFSVSATLPVNYIGLLGTWRDYFVLSNTENYKAVIEIDYTDNRLQMILTPEDKKKFEEMEIKIFNGLLRSNEVNMIPINE
jgi:hypothetical protein